MIYTHTMIQISFSKDIFLRETGWEPNNLDSSFSQTMANLSGNQILKVLRLKIVARLQNKQTFVIRMKIN